MTTQLIRQRCIIDLPRLVALANLFDVLAIRTSRPLLTNDEDCFAAGLQNININAGTVHLLNPVRDFAADELARPAALMLFLFTQKHSCLLAQHSCGGAVDHIDQKGGPDGVTALTSAMDIMIIERLCPVIDVANNVKAD